MYTHVMTDDEPQAVDLIITQVQRVCPYNCHFFALFIMPPETNAPILIHCLTGWFGYIMIQSRKEQKRAHRTICVE